MTPDPAANSIDSLTEIGPALLQQLQDFLGDSRRSTGPVVQLKHPRRALEDLHLTDLLNGEAHTAADILAFFAQYLGAATKVHDPRFMGHQVAVPHPISALGDLLHGVTNNGYGTYEMGPQAAAVELAVVDWFLAKVGWGGAQKGGGLLTHGGSLANLTALLSARAQAFPQAWQDGLPSQAVLLAPAMSHYSVQRAAAIMGLGTDSVLPIPVDTRGVIEPSGLQELLVELQAQQRPILAVVANACATATGLYDPLQKIAELCTKHQVWLHVDGCHGASALISERYKHYLDGIEGADSVSWDAHKLLGSSALCAAVLFREEKSVYQSFHQQESYLSGDAGGEELPFLRSLECTKSGLGLRLFLVLALHGEQKLVKDLEVMFQLTRQLHENLQANPAFELACAPQSNILLFRPQVENQAIEAIRLDLIARGAPYCSAADYAGKRWLRACIMNPATDEATLQLLEEQVLASAAALANCASSRL